MTAIEVSLTRREKEKITGYKAQGLGCRVFEESLSYHARSKNPEHAALHLVVLS